MASKKMIDSTPHFARQEMQCKGFNCCGHDCKMDFEHMVKLEKVRAIVGELKINSAYRCKTHNQAVGGVPNSWHMKGMASDGVPLETSLDTLEKVARAFFSEVIRYKSFVHMGA